MTGAELARARGRLGLSVEQLAEVLGLAPGSTRNLRRYEAGTRPVPDSVAGPVGRFLAGERPPNWPAAPAHRRQGGAHG